MLLLSKVKLNSVFSVNIQTVTKSCHGRVSNLPFGSFPKGWAPLAVSFLGNRGRLGQARHKH